MPRFSTAPSSPRARTDSRRYGVAEAPRDFTVRKIENITFEQQHTAEAPSLRPPPPRPRARSDLRRYGDAEGLEEGVPTKVIDIVNNWERVEELPQLEGSRCYGDHVVAVDRAENQTAHVASAAKCLDNLEKLISDSHDKYLQEVGQSKWREDLQADASLGLTNTDASELQLKALQADDALLADDASDCCGLPNDDDDEVPDDVDISLDFKMTALQDVAIIEDPNGYRRELKGQTCSWVTLHVYDFSSTTQAIGLPIYHLAIEVYHVEYFFSSSGIQQTRPGGHPAHVYRKAVHLGETHLQEREVQDMINSLHKVWPSSAYSMLGPNCQSFAVSFTEMLGVSTEILASYSRFSKLHQGFSGIFGALMGHTAP